MSTEGDAYLMPSMLAFDTRERLDGFLAALQAVIDRHNILRTAVVWEGLPEPVQVVLRAAPLVVEEVALDAEAGDMAEQLRARFDPRHYRLDVRQAPLVRGVIVRDTAQRRWLLFVLEHHLALDHTASEILVEEVQAHLVGQVERLPAPLPFRNFVAQARLGVSREEHEAFFRAMLGDIEEPTAPFGLLDVQGDGSEIEEARVDLDIDLSQRLRARARTLGVSAASLCHVAFAQVLARTSGCEDVVFGTVLFGRMQGGAGADRVLGMFINTLPVRIKVGEAGVAEAVRGAHVLLAELLRHEHAPLALAQRCSAVPAPAPLFSALFNYRYSLEDGQAASVEAEIAWDGIEMLDSEERTNYPVTLSVDDLSEGFRLTAQVQRPIAPERLCGYMQTVLVHLVEALEEAPETAVCAIDVLPESERRQLLVEWNATQTDYPQDKCIHQLFEVQVERSPEGTAVVYEDQALSYRELNAKANQLAHHLRSMGVGPDTLVGICVDRSLEMVIGLLGILKAGGAYVPLDPTYPKERLAYMLEDARPSVLLTQARLRHVLPAHPNIFCLDTDWSPIGRRSKKNLATLTSPLNLAYVIYTSGSTGRPKGVLVSNRGVVRLVRGMNYFSVGPQDIFLQFAPLAFDASTFEIWGSLLNGATLALSPNSKINALERLGETIQQYRITHLWLTAALFHQVVDQHPESLAGVRQLLAGGDVLSVPHVRKFCEIFPECTLINGYGPTENTTFSTTERIHTRGLGTNVPIGRPISNSVAYVLDKDMNLAPIGVTGELYVGGDGLARGYLNQSQLTARAFVPNPFSKELGARLYRTDDLARWRADGGIEFLGRIDNQVKIRGFRIELGEIEARLMEHPKVKEAAVIDREDTSGEKRVVAYVVSKDEDLAIEVLRDHVKAALPDYMVPAAFAFLDALPLTPNGKIDRKVLPAPDLIAQLAHQYVPPRNATEEILAGIWAEVLGVERIGIHDNFFELGGHSLLATRLLFKIKESFGTQVALSTLLDAPTLETQAKLLGCPNESHSPERREVNFAAEGILESSIFPNSPLIGNSSNPSAILLTGATGFLGAFLLYEYLQQTLGVVYCLVRAFSTTEASTRIERTLVHYRLWHSAFKKRIFPICGDLSKPLMGLSDEVWKHLAKEVNVVCHNGAWVNFVHPYSTLKPANVLGTQELLRLACTEKTKPFHYVSTAGVFSNSVGPQRPVYTEVDALPVDSIPNGGYSQTKRVAEQLVRSAGARGLPISIYRPSLIVGDSFTGACNADDFFFRVLRGYISLGKAPKGEGRLDLVTVDYVSQGIVWLSRKIKGAGNTFHLTNPVETPLRTVIEWTNSLGYRVETIPDSDWNAELYRAIQGNEDHPLFPLYSLLDQAFEAESNSTVHIPHLDCRDTLNRLAESGIVCPKIIAEMWSKYLVWLKQNDFQKRF